jgi:hypothetical protein
MPARWQSYRYVIKFMGMVVGNKWVNISPMSINGSCPRDRAENTRVFVTVMPQISGECNIRWKRYDQYCCYNNKLD